MPLFRKGAEQSASTLVTAIYDAALDPSKWQNFVQLIQSEAPGVEPVFYLADTKTAIIEELLVSHDWRREFLHEYLAYYNALNPWVPALAGSAQVGKPVIGESFVPDAALRQTEFWNDFFKKHWDGAGVIGVVNYRDAHSFSVLGLHYRKKRAERDERALKRLAGQLSPHVTRAFEISRQLQHGAARRASMEQMLDALSTAALVVTADLRIRYANMAADWMFRKGVLSLDTGQHLAAGNRTEETKRLRAAITEAHLHQMREPAAIKLSRPGDGAGSMPLLARLMPLAGGMNHGVAEAGLVPRPAAEGEVLVLITDPEAELDLSLRHVRDLFHVTIAEARLAQALVRGVSLRDYAGAAGLSEETVRGQLKSVFAKTNTHRQGELVSLLARLAQTIRLRD